MIEIKYYSKEFEKAHIDFAKKYWTKKRRLTPEYIYWKFRGSSNDTLTSFILAFDNNKVVGQFGLIPCKVIIDKKVYEAQWACDLMVDTDYRGKGIAEKLYDFAHKNKIITLGSDPSPAAEKSMIKNGYISLNGPRKFVFPFYIGEVFKLKHINNALLNKIPNPFLVFFFFFKNKDYTIIQSDEFKKLRIHKNENQIYCQHDISFYNWRFSEFKDYYKGIICFKKNDKNYFTGYFNGGIFYLTDFKVSSLLGFFKLIGFIYKEYSSLKIKRIKFVSMYSKINSIISFLGFIRFSTITKIILFTKSLDIKEYSSNKSFYYTLHDSDENI
jgi:GNAT superfamily N-acetyltransferase